LCVQSQANLTVPSACKSTRPRTNPSRRRHHRFESGWVRVCGVAPTRQIRTKRHRRTTLTPLGRAQGRRSIKTNERNASRLVNARVRRQSRPGWDRLLQTHWPSRPVVTPSADQLLEQSPGPGPRCRTI
jgi:hypothetical protein